MALCSDCGKKLGFFNGDEGGLCFECYDVKISDQKRVRWDEYTQGDILINRILLTTESNPDLNITKRIEIVTAECAYGMNIFKDLFAGVRNIVGGRSEAVQSTMRDARKTVLSELKREAHAVGANAVVGVDLDYVELAGSGSSMLMLVASGTAVVIEDAKN